MKSKISIKVKAVVIAALMATACGHSGPEAINLNKDDCDNCKMSISDKRFACEIVTEKGKVYKFDDVSCLMGFKGDNSEKMANATYYISNFLSPNELLKADGLFFVEGENVASPMGGNIAAFLNGDSAKEYEARWQAQSTKWSNIK